MQLLWIQQLAVLPVIVEDGNMAEENVQGRGLPLDSQPSARNRLGERERPTQARTLSVLLFFSSHPHSANPVHGFFCSQALTV